MPSPRGETGRALSNPTLQTPKGPSSKPPTRAAPPAEAQADSAAAARGRQTCARSAGRAGGHSRSGREHPARKARGRRVHALKLGVRGAHPRRTDAAPSGDLRRARHMQPDESLFG